MVVRKRTSTTKDISLLRQLHSLGQLTLAPEFQRDSVWPKPAKAYLIDTILNDKPVPPLFFQRSQSVQTGNPQYAIIDGQQRLRAIFEFLDDRFRLTEGARKGKLYSQLSEADKGVILSYALDVQELYGYDESDIKDIFARMNKYVVKLAPQELRHAKAGSGRFAKFAEQIGKLPFWVDHKVFSPQQRKRMRHIEFAAELAILLLEGPQDKKSSVDLYYGKYKDSFGPDAHLGKRIQAYLRWIGKALPDLQETRYRSPTDLYSLIGALHDVAGESAKLSAINPVVAGKALRAFDKQTKSGPTSGDAARYLVAASRQTDNIQPRNTRIQVLASIVRKA
jgi:hypothetical protein